MVEMDTFERRLADALLSHANDVSLAVDAAAVAHRVAHEHPRRRAMVFRRRAAAVPRVAWALVLLAALLTALVAGMLVVGSQPMRRLPAVVPPVGPVFVCPPGSTPDQPGPVEQVRPIEWMSVFDRRAGKLVAVADGHPGVETWTFDVCTNTWLRMHPDREPPPDMNQLVYDVDSDVTIASDGTRMWAYDFEANTWTEKGLFAPVRDVSLKFYDPVSGRVVAQGDDGDDATLGLELWSYGVETNTWTPIPQADRLVIGRRIGFSDFFVYDSSVDRLVAYARTWEAAGTWLFDLRTGTWLGMGAVTPPLFGGGIYGSDGPGCAYDEAAERTVMLGQGDPAAQGYSAAYDATADRWETLFEGAPSKDQPAGCGNHPECRHANQIVYDPVNARLVVFGGSIPTADGVGVDPDDMLAFDTRTREWTVLLAPSEGRAAP